MNNKLTQGVHCVHEISFEWHTNHIRWPISQRDRSLNHEWTLCTLIGKQNIKKKYAPE